MRLLAAVAFAVASGWQVGPPLPLPRGEVAGASFRGGVAVVGGLLADGSSSPRAELFRPGKGWTRLPDLPVAVTHAMAAASGDHLYVVGGYRSRVPQRAAFVLDHDRWHPLPSLPAGRAAGGAAIVSGVLYVVGGVGSGGLAHTVFAYPLAGRRWSVLPGPTPRQHLGVAALGGRIYAVGGRRAGYDTNVSAVESWKPGAARWRKLPSLPQPRGGAGLAAVAGRLVSVGGESPAGTSAAAYAYRPGAASWTRLPNLPTPRHGLAVVSVGKTVHVIGGGPLPGLSVSGIHEWLELR